MTRPRSRRPEGLTAGELEEWQRFAATARPLGGRKPPAAQPAPQVPPASQAAEPAPGRPPPAAAASPRRSPPPLEIGRHPPGVDGTRWGGLAQGTLRAERRLDLHGKTLAAAHAATRAFIEAAWRDGCRVIEIVTGLGARGEGRIRAEFPHWLNAPELRGRVLAAAYPHRANAGSVRLLLKRRRRG